MARCRNSGSAPLLAFESQVPLSRAIAATTPKRVRRHPRTRRHSPGAQGPGTEKARSADKPERYPVSPRGFRAELLDGGHSHRLRAFRSLGDFELDALIFLKGAKTIPLDLRMVDEYVFCAAIRGDKTEALFVIEPLDGSLCHSNFFLFKMSVITFIHSQPTVT